MAIVQISQIQVRRGLNQDLPQLASGEMGWSLDTRQLYIGNGTLVEGAPTEGITEILTEYSDILALSGTYTFKGLSSGVVVNTGPDVLHPVVRTLQDKLDDVVSVKDFGAIGDGIADDTAAIQRALTRVFGTAQNVLLTYHHRTIYFPAGLYKITSTLNIPPYTRIQGEGKKTTVIQGSMEAPLAQLVDSYGQSGFEYGAEDINGNIPYVSEYHFNDLSFTHASPNFDQSCFLIDGCWTVTFTRVMFNGLLSSTSGDYSGSLATTNPIYNVDRGSGVAAVELRNLSNNIANRNIVFNECDFYQHNYGIEINNDNHGITINDCYFDRLYHFIIAGNNSVAPLTYSPYGITLSNNYLRYSAAEGVYCGPYVSQVMSIGNLFTAWGNQDGESYTPVLNPNGIAQTPAIVFNADGNYSIVESFENDSINPLIKLIENNGYSCYIIEQSVGTVSGRRTDGMGRALELAIANSFTNTGAVLPTSYHNATINYSTADSNGRVRTGTIIAIGAGGSYTYSEEYNANVTSPIAFRINPTTGVLEYTSSNAFELLYNVTYFNSTLY